ncbi:MAG: bile acid:sodium symporter [Phycisphaerae bacterium]|nr:bile acid:sodium symporter [Phycisphaerae bacterium]
MKFFEKYFWALAVAATLVGLFWPAVGMPFRKVALFLMGILFFSGLKLDFAAALREFRRPAFLLYVAAMCLVVLPLGIWLLARLVLPQPFALGVLILAVMPAGVVCSSLADIARGNAALALIITLVTTALCPLIAPPIISLATGELLAGGTGRLLAQSAYLAAILFVPLAAAYLVRRFRPALVARHRDAFTGASIVFLTLVILGSMSVASNDCMQWVRSSPLEAVRLTAFLFGFSAVLHVAGYFIAPWRRPEDRAALSITAAYVNNGLGIVFSQAFFFPRFGAAAMLPSVLLEIPMTLAILPVRWYLARLRSRTPLTETAKA